MHAKEMSEEKFVFVINAALFDASLPLIRELKEQVNLYCIFEVYPSGPNQLRVCDADFKDRSVIDGCNIDSLQSYADYIPLEKTKIVKFGRPSSPLRHLSSILSMKRTIEKIEPDFVYFYNVPYTAIGYLYCNSTPCATAVHDPILHSSQNNASYYEIMRKLIFKRCRHFFLFSENLIDEFAKHYSISKDKIHLTRLGAYEQLNKNKSHHQIGEGLKLLFFGRISPYKGLRYLLEAFDIVKKRGYEDVSLTVIGGGKIETDIIDLNQPGLKVINRFYSEDELVNELEKCDIVVCPYTDATQSGVMMSAYAFRKPGIVSNVGGLTEMVSHNENGFVVPPADSVALSEAIIFIRENKEVVYNWCNAIEKKYGPTGELGWKNISSNLIKELNIIRKEWK